MTNSDFHRSAGSASELLDLLPRRLDWLFARGRTRPDEPLYGCQIKDGDEIVSQTEHDDPEQCATLAIEGLRVHPCEYCHKKFTGLPGNACENCMNSGLRYPEIEHMGAATVEADDIKRFFDGMAAANRRSTHMHDVAQSVQVPAGYIMVPRELTAENGAKSALIGEFNEEFGCLDEDGDEQFANVPVTWTTIKAIHKKMVAHFAAQPPAAPVVPPEVLERRRKGLPDYERPPLGQPPSWLQEQEKIERHNGSSAVSEPAAWLSTGDNHHGLWREKPDLGDGFQVQPLYLRASPQTLWQPIETAPKDGTKVLLRFDPPFHDTTENGITVGCMTTAGNWWLSCIWASSGAHREPVEWAPIPSSVSRPESK